MAGGIQIPVDANITALQKKLDALGEKIDKINRKKWEPVDPAEVDRQAQRVERTLDTTRNRISQTRREEREEEEEPGRRTRRHIRHRYTVAPDLADIPRGALSGFGGGVSQIAGAGTRGAIAGATGGGGIGGGIAGLLRGSAIGALAFGAFKLGQAASQGIDMARERAGTLDTLKRQMGDVGVSFDRLRIASDNVAYGLGINSKDFAALEQQMNVASRGADAGDPRALAAATSMAAGFARSYGMDPGATANLFGGVKNVDKRQDYGQFAMILASTIEKSSMASRADEVGQALVTFGQLASKLSLSAPNYAAFGGAYAGMVNSGITGATPELAAQILTQANAAQSQMGAAGEAGQAFTLAAFQRSGRGLNPLEASAQASGGLFGTRASVYGPNSAMSSLLGDKAASRLAGGPGADKTNFEMIREQAQAMTGKGTTGKELQAEMLQRYYGLQSIQQAALLMKIQDAGEMGGLQKQIAAAGIDPSKVNFTNIQTLAKIGNAPKRQDLDTIYADMKTRTGGSALTTEDTAKIEKARAGGNVEEYRKSLFGAAQGKDYSETMSTAAKQSAAALETIQTQVGGPLMQGITKIDQDLVLMMGGRKKQDEMRLEDTKYGFGQSTDALQKEAQKERDEAFAMPRDKFGMETEAEKKRLKEIDAKFDPAIANEQNMMAVEMAKPGSTQEKTGPHGIVTHELIVHVRQTDPRTGQTTTNSTTVPLGQPRAGGTDVTAH